MEFDINLFQVFNLHRLKLIVNYCQALNLGVRIISHTMPQENGIGHMSNDAIHCVIMVNG